MGRSSIKVDLRDIEVDLRGVVATRVKAYEAKHTPIRPPRFEAAVQYEMERGMIRRKDSLETV